MITPGLTCACHALTWQVSFLTPAELFTPWYGAILARHIFEHRKHNLGQDGAPLNIIEIGGGNGTLAKDILVRRSAHTHHASQP